MPCSSTFVSSTTFIEFHIQFHTLFHKSTHQTLPFRQKEFLQIFPVSEETYIVSEIGPEWFYWECEVLTPGYVKIEISFLFHESTNHTLPFGQIQFLKIFLVA